MSEMPRKEDRRVRRTKKMLTQALTKLMNQKQLNEITVKELAELADMNRGTFYLYYKDIYDMLAKIENSMFTALYEIMNQHEQAGALTDLRDMLRKVFEFISENREMCGVLLSENGDMSFLHRLNDLLRERCRAIWNARNIPDKDAEYDYYYSFAVFGCAGLIRAWLLNNCAEPPEYMAALSDKMLTRGGI